MNRDDDRARAVCLTAIANGASLPLLLAVSPGGRVKEAAHTWIGEVACSVGERAMAVKAPGRAVRLARAFRRDPVGTARTCVRAAKLLPAVRRALPWYVQGILVAAAAVKCLPLDFGIDETLFVIAFVLILWKRPGLLDSLYREAQAGKPARCVCDRHARGRVVMLAR